MNNISDTQENDKVKLQQPIGIWVMVFTTFTIFVHSTDFPEDIKLFEMFVTNLEKILNLIVKKKHKDYNYNLLHNYADVNNKNTRTYLWIFRYYIILCRIARRYLPQFRILWVTNTCAFLGPFWCCIITKWKTALLNQGSFYPNNSVVYK